MKKIFIFSDTVTFFSLCQQKEQNFFAWKRKLPSERTYPLDLYILEFVFDVEQIFFGTHLQRLNILHDVTLLLLGLIKFNWNCKRQNTICSRFIQSLSNKLKHNCLNYCNKLLWYYTLVWLARLNAVFTWLSFRA